VEGNDNRYSITLPAKWSGGVMGSNARGSMVGSFSGNIFNNGRIRIEIGEEYCCDRCSWYSCGGGVDVLSPQKEANEK